MTQKEFFIGNIPAILLGEPSDRVYLFVHGQGGSKTEAAAFAEVAAPAGFQVLGVDLPKHGDRAEDTAELLPWTVIPELNTVNDYLTAHWRHISIRANSIGAWLCMLAFADKTVEKCLFVSPILDMERLIADMMRWASVTEARLRQEKEIATDFGQTLFWDYLTYVRQHPIAAWKHPTEILYAGQDNMTQRKTATDFAEKFGCGLSVMENGEHWFHTPEQLRFLKEWEKSKL